MADTAKITVACTEPDTCRDICDKLPSMAAIHQDFGKEITADGLMPESFDVIVSEGLRSSDEPVELRISNMFELLKPGGRLCLQGDEDLACYMKDRPEAESVAMISRAHARVIIVQKRWPLIKSGIVWTTNRDREVVLLLPTRLNDSARETIRELTVRIESHGLRVFAISAHGPIDESVVNNKHCISLLEFDQSILEDITEEYFAMIKVLVLKTSSLLWVTGFEGPSSKIVDGLARVVRNETPGLRFRTFHAGNPTKISADLAGLLCQAACSDSAEDEFAVIDNRLYIGRIEEDHAINKQINGLLPSGAKTMSRMRLGDIAFPVKLTVQSPGMLDSICMEYDSAAESELDPSDVEINVKVSSIK